MLKRINWYFWFGAFFVVIGVLFLFTGAWLSAAWSITLGAGNWFVAYGQRHPERVRGWRGWAIAIPWLVVMAVLTFLRLRAA